jgi:hypothetical protein
VYHFQKSIELAQKPSRYQLFANGQRAAWGPARGDLFHWRYETVDLTRYLQAGKNTPSGVVWNFGQSAPSTSARSVSERASLRPSRCCHRFRANSCKGPASPAESQQVIRYASEAAPTFVSKPAQAPTPR